MDKQTQKRKTKEFIKRRTGGKGNKSKVSKKQIFQIVEGNKEDFEDNFKQLLSEGEIFESSKGRYQWV